MNPLKPTAYAYYHDGQVDDEHHPIVQNRPKSRDSFRQEPWKEVALYPLDLSTEPFAWVKSLPGRRFDITMDLMVRDEWLAERWVLTPLYTGLQLRNFVNKPPLHDPDIVYNVLTRDPTEPTHD